MEFTNRGEEFEANFNVLDDALRERLATTGDQRNGRLSFAEMVRVLQKHDSAVRIYADDLLEYSDLRNAIVHSRGRDGLRVIAEPVPEALADFKAIVQELTNPQSALSLSGGAPRHFAPGDHLNQALAYMREHDFSQVVVKDGKGPLLLLTANGISRWLERHAGDGAVALNGRIAIADALRFEQQHSFELVNRDATAHDVRELFQRFPASGASRLQAVIVTENAQPTEKALGIVTPWDLFSGPPA
ncbi:MAG: hypothetical protein ACRDHN_02705 [Thermomicrobiales bacterium]